MTAERHSGGESPHRLSTGVPSKAVNPAALIRSALNPLFSSSLTDKNMRENSGYSEICEMRWKVLDILYECNDQPQPPVVAKQCSKTQKSDYNQYTQRADNKDDCYGSWVLSSMPNSVDIAQFLGM